MTMITCLIDDATPSHRALTNEHGLSLCIRVGDKSILFDCGSSDALVRNAATLGVDLTMAETVVLSHGHYDHTGGFRAVASLGGVSRLVTGPGFFTPKYSRKGMRLTRMGANFGPDFLADAGITHEVCGDILELCPGCWALGNPERSHSAETIPDRYVLRLDGEIQPDRFADEISLAVRCGDGVAVIVGCSHPGILNIVETVERRLALPVHGVWGGTHLVEATSDRIDFTVETLRKKGIRHLGFSHCSGEMARERIQAHPAFEACALCAGDEIVL
ncbi:MAG: MBL fold metallo-hydrolase [Planctomycetaceae bacterium]|nr:MBL fold metallo-hydrolase [Planctomycetaceae bacterium]